MEEWFEVQQVSILLVVDVALEGAIVFAPEREVFSFNPSCSGCGS